MWSEMREVALNNEIGYRDESTVQRAKNVTNPKPDDRKEK